MSLCCTEQLVAIRSNLIGAFRPSRGAVRTQPVGTIAHLGILKKVQETRLERCFNRVLIYTRRWIAQYARSWLSRHAR